MSVDTSELAAESVYLAPNWRLFSGIYAGITLLNGLLAFLSEVFLKAEWPTILNFVFFGIAVWIAGGKYREATAGRWTRADRHRLALVYTAASYVISTILFAALSVFDPSLIQMLTSSAWTIAFLVVVGLVLLPIHYGIARWVLPQIDRDAERRSAKAAQPALPGDQ